jgi:hypothetical protein
VKDDVANLGADADVVGGDLVAVAPVVVLGLVGAVGGFEFEVERVLAPQRDEVAPVLLTADALRPGAARGDAGGAGDGQVGMALLRRPGAVAGGEAHEGGGGAAVLAARRAVAVKALVVVALVVAAARAEGEDGRGAVGRALLKRRGDGQPLVADGALRRGAEKLADEVVAWYSRLLLARDVLLKWFAATAVAGAVRTYVRFG